MPATARARVFRSGNSQAVRLPKEFRFRSQVVEIWRRGDEIVLRECATSLDEAFDLLSSLSRDFFAGGRKTTSLEKRRRLKG